MHKDNGNIFVILLVVLALGVGTFFAFNNKSISLNISDNSATNRVINPQPQENIVSKPTLPEPPIQYQLTGASHVFQTFNNCGPASLSMALSLYDINVSQTDLGNELRPYQNAAGNNDDKSVTLEELAEKAKDYDLVPYHRPNGDINKIKAFIAQGIPVITRTLLTVGDDIGHYRVVTGYNDDGGYIVQNDSLQGKDLHYSYDNFLGLWKPYGYEYLILVPKDKTEVVKAILNDEVDTKTAWENAVVRLQSEILKDPNDIQLKFALSVAYYHIGEYERSIEQFEAVEGKLPFRTLWYQIEPLLAYQELKSYDELLPRIQTILDRQNRAFSELYQIRGEVYLDQGRVEDARREFDTALVYKHNFKPAQDALIDL